MKKVPFSFGVLLILLFPIALAQGFDPLYANLDTVNGEQMIDLGTLSTELPQESSPIDLQYGSAQGYDDNNDGIASQNEVVDIEVKAHAPFENPVCVRWEIYSIDTGSSDSVCHGAAECCEALKLAPSRYEWDAPLYLTYGAYGSTKSNIVSVQSIEMKGVNLAYSKWKSLDAVFTENREELLKEFSQDFAILKAEHPSISSVRLLDENGESVTTLGKGEKADVEITLTDKSSTPSAQLGILAVSLVTKGTTVILENMDEASIALIDGLDIADENKPLENAIAKAGIHPVQLVSVGNAESIGAQGGRVVFQKEEFTTVLHCASDEASACTVLPTCGNAQESCYEESTAEIIVYVPHFSSIILGIENETLQLNISSPTNETAIENGENVYFNATSNITITLNYSLDGGQIASMENATSFSILLNGSLSYGTLANGNHSLRIGVFTSLGTNSTIEYSFAINDAVAPSFTLNMSNNSAHSATYPSLHLLVTSTEFGNVSYALNGQQPTLSPLNASKMATLQFSPQQGSNMMEIQVSDAQGNIASAMYAFTFTELGSCTDGVKNGPETGIDCGGSCSSCIQFNASTDRQSYNLSDTAYITVISRANAVVNVTVKRGNDISWRHEFRPAFAGFPIAETRAIANTSTAGNYTLNATMYYLNVTEQKNVSFEVIAPYQSPMAVLISANATTINENNDAYFLSSVSGNSSAVSYRWDFQNDGTIDSTLPNLTWRFPGNGTFTINLTVSDKAGNQTDLESITVRKTFNLTVRVRDNSTGANVQHAILEVGPYEANTSSDGSAVFTIPKGSYDIDVSHDNYRSYSDETNLNSNQEYYANVSIADRLAPVITLLSPENGSTAYNNSIDFAYSTFDTSPVTCVLYTRANSVLWKQSASVFLPSPSGQYQFTLNNLELAPYEWKVECRDMDGNYNTTSPFSLTIDPASKPNELSVDLKEQDMDTAELEAIITKSMEDLKDLNGRDSEIADAIELRKTLEKALTSVKRANRDLHSLEWRRLNESELEKETNAILERLEELKKATPKKFTVLEAREFVSYASRPDVETVVQMLVDLANAKVSKKDLAKLVDENVKLQSLLTITTKASRVEIEDIEGGSKKYTVVVKKVAATTEDFVLYAYYEVIPKEVVKTTDQMDIFAEHEVIQEDPVLSFDLAKTKEYAYLIKEDVPLQRIEGIASVLALQQVTVKKVGLITGFSILGDVSKGLRETVDIRLVVEVIIIAILVVVYLIYSIGSLEDFKRRFEPKDVKEFREKAGHAQQEIENGAYEGASAVYKEVAIAYKSLPPKKRAELNAIVTQLLNQVNVLYINKLISEADGALMKKDRKEMAQAYAKIRALYRIISRDYKAQVWKKCMELHRQLSEK